MNKDCEVTIESIVPKKSEPIYRTIPKTDSIVDGVIDQLVSRAQIGKSKYKTDLDRQDLGLVDWVQHIQEELLDAVNYLEKLKVILGGKKRGSID